MNNHESSENSSLPVSSHSRGFLVSNFLHNNERKNLLKWSVWFFTSTFVVTLLIALRYFSVYDFPREPLAVLYTLFAFVSHFGSIFLILWVAIIVPMLLLFPLKKVVIPLSVFIASFIMILVLLDSQVFTAHRFHFSLLTIRIFGFSTWGFGIIYLVICGIFSSFLAKLSWERTVIKAKRNYGLITLPAILVMLLGTHGAHIWADATGYVPITRFTTTLPMFYPSTDKKHMVKWGFAKNTNRPHYTAATSGSSLKYPLKPLTFSPVAPLNVLIIAVDDMRADLLSDSISQRIATFAATSGISFDNHWSGGNSTKMGLFSLFYGIAPTYQQHIESNQISPIFIDLLLKRNYLTGIFTSYKLYAPACLHSTAFVNIPDLRLETKIPGAPSPVRNDSAITREWTSWLDMRDTSRPFFGFVFYDALSAKAFPQSFSRFSSLQESATEMETSLIRYKVSMMYVDSLVGAVLDDLERRSLLSSTIVIITSDHGEEFDDNDLDIKGHGSAFSDWQTRVPLVVHWPGKSPNVISKRTSHNDISATLIKNAFGCTNPESDFSSGVSLFSDESWNWLIVGSYYNFAIMEPQQITIMFPGGYFEHRDHRYRILTKPEYSVNLSSAMSEMGRFFR